MRRASKTAIYDSWIVIPAVALLALGLLMVTSASMVISDRQYHYPAHFLLHQTLCLTLGLGLAFLIMKIPLRMLQKVSGYFLLISIGLLVLVLIPGLGMVVNGSRRWLHFYLISFQVSELIKISAILYFASYLVRFDEQIKQNFYAFFKPLLILILIASLLLLEPDFGAAVVVSIIFLSLFFLAGVRLRSFLLLFLLIALAAIVLALISPYRIKRLTSFLNPWIYPFGSGYQLTQSLIAFGRGGLWGLGLGNSVQKLFYLPEAHTDFLFAVIGEELGLVGLLGILILFIMLITRMIWIAYKAQQIGAYFASYLAYGIAIWFGLQTFINMGVNMGLLPTKGLTLPLMSYGGMSMLVNCLVIGMILRIAYEVLPRNAKIKKT